MDGRVLNKGKKNIRRLNLNEDSKKQKPLSIAIGRYFQIIFYPHSFWRRGKDPCLLFVQFVTVYLRVKAKVAFEMEMNIQNCAETGVLFPKTIGM